MDHQEGLEAGVDQIMMQSVVARHTLWVMPAVGAGFVQLVATTVAFLLSSQRS